MSRGAHSNSNASSDERGEGNSKEGGRENERENGRENGKEGGAIAIDSYNVHRLVIAGLTVASKFFSDVFYLNSRYAKVRYPFCLAFLSVSLRLGRYSRQFGLPATRFPARTRVYEHDLSRTRHPVASTSFWLIRSGSTGASPPFIVRSSDPQTRNE